MVFLFYPGALQCWCCGKSVSRSPRSALSSPLLRKALPLVSPKSPGLPSPSSSPGELNEVPRKSANPSVQHFVLKAEEYNITIITNFSLFARLVQKARKTVFFEFFTNFLQSVLKKMKKRCFLTLFAGHWARSSKNSFFAFFANFLQSVLKNAKKRYFLTLFAGHRAESSKNAVVSHILRTLYKVSRKTWKNTVFSHFLQDIVQKAQKTLFFCLKVAYSALVISFSSAADILWTSITIKGCVEIKRKI